MTRTHASSTPGAAPAAPFADMPWLTLGAVAGALEPIARQATRTNLELTSLAGERAMAYMALPTTLARCHTPIDLVQAQFAFWQRAGHQYAECAERLAAGWRTCAVADDRDGHIEPRDAIGFPEPKSEPSYEAGRRPGDGRRAA